MGYLCLLLALLSGSVKGYCGKRTSGCVREYKDAMFTNFIRMIFCVVISLAQICVQGDAGLLKADIKVILIRQCVKLKNKRKWKKRKFLKMLIIMK